MQNTSDSYPHARLIRQRMHLAIFCACFSVLTAALVIFAPAVAEAKSYSMPSVDIQAQVETDGSLRVTEQRTFNFDGDFTAVWWSFDNLPSGAEIKVNGVRTGQVDNEGVLSGEWTSLESVPFVLSWREEGGPGTTAYSFDKPKNTVYVFFDASDERMLVELDYTVVNGVQAYKDVGEVYWQYIGSQWIEDSSNVSMTLALPVPQGTIVEAGNNVRAWGHGPLDGTFTVNADGTVTYRVARVASGKFAEARVVFPVSWMTNLSTESLLLHQNETRLETILGEEEVWADQANRTRTLELAFVIVYGVVCVLLLAWALYVYYRHGRERKPDFTEEYWRDVPDPAVHPAMIGRLWRWNRESPDDFLATLMHLAHVGAVRIDSGRYPHSDLFGTKQMDDYYITELPAAREIDDPVDRAALNLLFNTIAKGHDSLWFGTIKKYGEKHQEEFVEAMEEWQGKLSAAVNREDFFESKGKYYQKALIVITTIIMVAGVVIWLMANSIIPLLFMVPTAVALGYIANYMPRRSVRGNNLVARCKALRNWLRDFSSLDERPPTDVKVWGEFMVYAYQFGVADQAIKQLQATMPELFEYDGSYGSTYMPWWFWYAGGYTSAGTFMPSMGDLFQTSVINTLSTAQGSGGGFSGGGGGGFGGGGGAR